MSLPELPADNPFAHHQSPASAVRSPWLPGLARALLWLQWGFVLGLFNLVGLVLLVAVANWSADAALKALLVPSALVWGLQIASCWVLSRQENGGRPARWSTSWLLWWLIVAQAAVMLSNLFLTHVLAPALSPLVGPDALIMMGLVSGVLVLTLFLAAVAWYVALFFRLRELARRLGNEPLARFAIRRMWWVLAMNTLGLLLIGLGPFIAVLMIVTLLRMVRTAVLAAASTQ